MVLASGLVSPDPGHRSTPRWCATCGGPSWSPGPAFSGAIAAAFPSETLGRRGASGTATAGPGRLARALRGRLSIPGQGGSACGRLRSCSRCGWRWLRAVPLAGGHVLPVPAPRRSQHLQGEAPADVSPRLRPSGDVGVPEAQAAEDHGLDEDTRAGSARRAMVRRFVQRLRITPSISRWSARSTGVTRRPLCVPASTWLPRLPAGPPPGPGEEGRRGGFLTVVSGNVVELAALCRRPRAGRGRGRHCPESFSSLPKVGDTFSSQQL